MAMVDAALLAICSRAGMEGRLDLQGEGQAAAQLAMADRIVLNKMDLLRQLPRAGAAADASKRPQKSVGGAVSEESVIAALRVSSSAALGAVATRAHCSSCSTRTRSSANWGIICVSRWSSGRCRTMRSTRRVRSR